MSADRLLVEVDPAVRARVRGLASMTSALMGRWRLRQGVDNGELLDPVREGVARREVPGGERGSAGFAGAPPWSSEQRRRDGAGRGGLTIRRSDLLSSPACGVEDVLVGLTSNVGFRQLVLSTRTLWWQTSGLLA